MQVTKDSYILSRNVIRVNNKTNKFYKAIKQSYIEYLMYTNNLEKIKVRKK